MTYELRKAASAHSQSTNRSSVQEAEIRVTVDGRAGQGTPSNSMTSPSAQNGDLDACR